MFLGTLRFSVIDHLLGILGPPLYLIVCHHTEVSPLRRSQSGRQPSGSHHRCVGVDPALDVRDDSLFAEIVQGIVIHSLHGLRIAREVLVLQMQHMGVWRDASRRRGQQSSPTDPNVLPRKAADRRWPDALRRAMRCCSRSRGPAGRTRQPTRRHPCRVG
jgi:hypothetical protein